MVPVSMNFGPQNCGAVPRTSVEDQGAARMIEDYYDFQRVLIYEQSVNHRRGPRSWPQIGAAATWLERIWRELKRPCSESLELGVHGCLERLAQLQNQLIDHNVAGSTPKAGAVALIRKTVEDRAGQGWAKQVIDANSRVYVILAADRSSDCRGDHVTRIVVAHRSVASQIGPDVP